MPFTFSHPAIVIPLRRSGMGLSLTALIFGSMVPDFEFYFRMKVAPNIGHHWNGFFLFDVPVAILLCFAFHNYVRNSLIQHLPEWYRIRFNSFRYFNWNEYVKKHKISVFISIIIGVLSHFLWDAFTHHDGTFVELFPVLSSTLSIFNQEIPVYFFLQVVSSAWGLFYIQSRIKKMSIQLVNNEKYQRLYWPIISLVAGFILVLRFLLQPEYHSFWNVFFAVMGSLIYSLLIVSIGYQQFKFISQREQLP